MASDLKVLSKDHSSLFTSKQPLLINHVVGLCSHQEPLATGNGSVGGGQRKRQEGTAKAQPCFPRGVFQGTGALELLVQLGAPVLWEARPAEQELFEVLRRASRPAEKHTCVQASLSNPRGGDPEPEDPHTGPHSGAARLPSRAAGLLRGFKRHQGPRGQRAPHLPGDRGCG